MYRWANQSHENQIYQELSDPLSMGFIKGVPFGNLTWLWKDPPFFMSKSTISTGPFSIAMLVYQMVPYFEALVT